MKNKISLFCLTLFTIVMQACDKQNFTTESPLAFEKETITLNSNEQVVEIKANHTAWYMRLHEDNSSTNEYADTISGDWFALEKKNRGEYLSLRVDSNIGAKRELQVYIANGMNTFSRIKIIQEGINR